ncbi:hypothetical protein P9112_005629 [Eukaryota sp. TZLM1-RC]
MSAANIRIIYCRISISIPHRFGLITLPQTPWNYLSNFLVAQFILFKFSLFSILHLVLSPHYCGLGWTKASILPSCAFIGGCRSTICEFSERFADWEDLLMTTQSSTIFALNEEISKIDVEKWSRCFPQSFNDNILEKNFLNLKYTLRT